MKSLRKTLKVLGATFPYFFRYEECHKHITEEYPDRVSARMPEDLPKRYRGFLTNDIDRCSGCRYCSDACPVDCIRIETEPGAQRNLSWVAVFDIDHSKCMFCGLCVEVCPTGSLVHTQEYQGSVYRLEEMVKSFGKGWASRDQKEMWLRDQMASDSMAEETAQLEKSPVGAEIMKRLKK